MLFPLSIIWELFLAPVEASVITLLQSTPDHIRGRMLSTTAMLTGDDQRGLVGGVLAWLVMRGQALHTGVVSE